MRASLKLDIDFWVAATVRASSFDVVRHLMLPPLFKSPIEDNLHRRIRRKPLPEILIKVGVPAGDNK